MCKIAALTLIAGAPVLLAMPSARAASDCSMLATLADWGQNSTAEIDLKSGASCQFPIRKHGVSGSDISQKPEHGKLKKLNITTYEYTAKAKYKGSDTFAIKATGQGRPASGTSIIAVHVTVR